MGKKAKAPKAPNYTALANQQAALAGQQWQKELTAARPNQVGPSGSLTWSKDPTTGEWTQQTAFNAPEQAVYEGQRDFQGQLAGKMGDVLGGMDTSQIDFSGAPEMPTVGGYDQRSIDTIRALQAPDLERRRAAKEAQLAAMGMGTGSGTAWNTEQQNIGDAENRADLEAILAGITQGNTMYNQGMQGRQQGVEEILAQRAGNLGQLTGLAGLAQPIQQPTFAGFSTPSAVGAVPNITGAAGQQYGAAMNQYNADQQSNSGLLGGIGSTLGTIGGFTMGGPAGGTVGGNLAGKAGSAVSKMFGK